MRITILTAGSTGDVLPYVALGEGLAAAGHRVALASHPIFEHLVSSHGLEFRVVEGNPRDIVASQVGVELMESESQLDVTRRMGAVIKPIMERWRADAREASADAELIMTSVLAIDGLWMAEERGIPAFFMAISPVHQNSLYPPHQTLFIRPYRRMEARRVPTLYGFSPSVVPKPPEWGDHVTVAGYWFLDQAPGYQPPPDLAAFIEAGPPPVAIGYGSMGDRDPETLTGISIEALRLAGQRGVLVSGWAGLKKEDLPDHVAAIEAIPHEWLFPRMAAAVHHAGPMTLAVALRAGIPGVSVPFFFDQLWWADRAAALGIGPKAVPRRTLTAESLAQAIDRAVTDDRIRKTVAEIGEQVRDEDGIATAVEAVARVTGS